MNLPLPLSLKPMLGRLVRELPEGELVFEPKWDGFRCLAFRDGDEIDLRSRHGNPLARYFPELVEGLQGLDHSRLVLDGEIVLADPERFDFGALMSRLHPAQSRVQLLREEWPTALICFDLLALGNDDLTSRPFHERRAALEQLFESVADGDTVRLSPIVDDRQAAAEWLDASPAPGIDGVMAKAPDAPYRPGARTMVKVKRERTLDCVVGGLRVFEDLAPASLLLGLYDERGELENIGVASSFAKRQHDELVVELGPRIRELAGHPWEHGFLKDGGPTGRLPGAAGRWTPEMELDWVPIEPDLVCEVAYEHLDHRRLRHPARFRRWRVDREARSCTFDQIA